MNDAEYNERMDRLATRISTAIDGEKSFDDAYACAAIIVYVLYKGFDDQKERLEAFDWLVKFMRDHLPTGDVY